MDTQSIEANVVEFAAEQAFPIPDDEKFDKPYIDAPDLSKIAYELMGEHHALEHLGDYRISYFWRKKGGMSKGRPVFGDTKLARGMISAFTDADAIIWLSADHLRFYRFSERQVRALLFHQLLQLDEDDEHEGNPILRLIAPEVHVFSQEIQHYGTWWPHPEPFENAVRQLDLGLGTQ